MITPERGRELLATPRAGQRGDTPAPAADLDPPGLAWLAEGDPGNFLTSYRFVLVESVEPAELPGRIGAPGDAVLNAPTTLWDSRTRFPGNGTVTWEDEALAAVGRAGPGWSFAFEAAPVGRFDERWFVSPGIAASRGTRAVTVWSEPSRAHRPGVFHLSVTEDGEERYAFTVRATSVSGRGPCRPRWTRTVSFRGTTRTPRAGRAPCPGGPCRRVRRPAAPVRPRSGTSPQLPDPALEPAAGPRRGLCDVGRGPRVTLMPYAGGRGGMPVHEVTGRSARGQG